MSKRHPAIKVASAKEGFRRAGHTFGAEPKTIALAALHPDAYAAIRADKSLVVVDSAIELSDEEAATLAHHDAKHVKDAAAHVAAMPVAVDEDHAKRAVALAGFEGVLNQREEDARARESKLDQREAELNAAADAIKRAQADLDERRAAFESQVAAHEASKHVSAEDAPQAKTGGKASR